MPDLFKSITLGMGLVLIAGYAWAYEEHILTTADPSPELLAAALQFGTPDQVLRCLEQQANPNGRMPENGMPYLLFSLDQGNLDSAAYLLEFGADIYQADRHGSTAFSLALSHHSEALLEFVLHHGKAQTWRKHLGNDQRVIHDLVRSANKNLLRILLEHGWDINPTDPNGDTPLIQAITQGNADMVQYLITQQADLYALNRQGRDALYYAILAQDITALRYLNRAGINTQHRYENQMTALMLAVSHRNVDAVRLLLRAGNDVHAVNSDGENAVVMALQRQHYRTGIVETLLHHGAAANSYGKSGQSALAMAVVARCYPCVEQLLAHGANPNDGGTQRVPNGDSLAWPPLFWAVEQQDAYLVERLLRAGADVNRRHPVDNTTAVNVAIAIETGKAEMLRLLVKHGAKVNVMDNIHWTPLIRACAASGIDVVNALIAAGADVNQPNGHGWTPLMAAAQDGSSGKIALLLRHGAHVNTQTSKGWTALSEAKREGHFDAVALLERAGGKDPANVQPKTRAERDGLKIEIKVVDK